MATRTRLPTPSQAERIIKMPLINQRLVVNSLEPRSRSANTRGGRKMDAAFLQQGVFGLRTC